MGDPECTSSFIHTLKKGRMLDCLSHCDISYNGTVKAVQHGNYSLGKCFGLLLLCLLLFEFKHLFFDFPFF